MNNTQVDVASQWMWIKFDFKTSSRWIFLHLWSSVCLCVCMLCRANIIRACWKLSKHFLLNENKTNSTKPIENDTTFYLQENLFRIIFSAFIGATLNTLYKWRKHSNAVLLLLNTYTLLAPSPFSSRRCFFKTKILLRASVDNE